MKKWKYKQPARTVRVQRLSERAATDAYYTTWVTRGGGDIFTLDIMICELDSMKIQVKIKSIDGAGQVCCELDGEEDSVAIAAVEHLGLMTRKQAEWAVGTIVNSYFMER